MSYNVPIVDFVGPLSKIGENFGSMRREQKIGEALSALGPDASFEDRAKAIMSVDPILGMKYLQSAETGLGVDRFGLNPVFDAEGNAYQTNSAGGLAPLNVPGGGQLVQPQTWKETSEGYVPLPSRGAVGGGIAVNPVQTQDVSPDGTMVPHQPAAVPSLKSVKQGREMRAEQATDKAIAESAIAKFDETIKNFSNLVDESGQPTEQLKAITGDTMGIPKAYLPNWSENARNAAANLETSAVQIGLNTLAEMRAASAQGASGMGQLAIQESKWLQNSIRSLQETQGTPQAAQHIADIIRYSKAIQGRIRQKYKEVYDEDLPTDGVPPPPATTDLPPTPDNINRPELEAIGKARKLLERGVSLQAIIAALRKDGVPESEIQKLTAGQ
jgi:hypothetical protein